MLISKKNNKGFSLVEVIVSMLVLSIVISSVLTAFSLSAKSNARTQKTQSAESLMEDLQELAGAVQDSSRFAGTCATMFGVETPTPQVLSSTQSLYELTGISKGSYSYDVDITIDTEPADYTGVNTTDVLSFGESDKATVLINASANADLLAGYSEYREDTEAINYFVNFRNDKIDADNAALPEGEEETPHVTADDIRGLVDRAVCLEAKETPTGKMQLACYFSYQLDASIDIGGVSRVKEEPIIPAQEFNKPGTGVPGEQELGRVYLLFSPFNSTSRGTVGNYDVRIWDATGQLLDADIYIVYQESAAEDVGDVLDKSLDERFTGETGKVFVSFDKRGTSGSKPKRVDLYSATEIECSPTLNVTVHSKKMIPSKPQMRVHTITIEIKDSDGVVLATDTVTSLQ